MNYRILFTFATAFAASTAVTTCSVLAADQFNGGGAASTVVGYVTAAFGASIGSAVLWGIVRGLKWLGVSITDAQKNQLQGIIVNGINDAAMRAQTQLRNNPNLSIDVRSQVVRDAISYAQKHGAGVITALGLDPQSGEAVEAIRARIATAIADPNTPTDPVVTPVASGGVAK